MAGMSRGPHRPRQRLLGASGVAALGLRTPPGARSKARRSGRPRPGGLGPGWTRRAWLCGAVVAALVVLAVLWVGLRFVQVRGHLEAARRDVALARDEVRQGHLAAAITAARSAQQATTATRGLASDPVWSLVARLPVAGSTLVVVQGVSRAADELATRVLPPLTAAADDLRAEHLRLPGGGGVDLGRLTSAGASLRSARSAVGDIRATVAGLPSRTLLGAAAGARSTLLEQLDQLDRQFRGAQTAVDLAPPMLGAQGPRRYFLALENTAEARGTGGIIGAYGVVLADHGRLSLDRAGGDGDLPVFSSPQTTISPEFTARWGDFGPAEDFRNANLSPHFPWAATILSALWLRSAHEQVDGVVALDPTAAGALLTATGPADLPDGTRLPGSELTAFVEKTLYQRYADRGQRQDALTAVQRAIFGRLTAAGGDPAPLLAALSRATGEGRLLLASNHANEQAALATTSAGGALPDTPGPYAGLVLTNASGDKLDYYLDRDVSWQAGPCAGPRRTTTLTATLTNTAPASGLPPYVTGEATVGRTVAPYSLKEYVSVYGTAGGQLSHVEVDGQSAVAIPGTERGHPVASLYVTLPAAGGRHTITVTWDEPSSGAVQPLHVQPLVRDASVTSSVPDCGPATPAAAAAGTTASP